MDTGSSTVQDFWREPRYRAWEQAHPCPNCGRAMHLTKNAACSSGISGFHTYACGECGLSAIEADEARQ